jgi:hypothetical protein
MYSCNKFTFSASHPTFIVTILLPLLVLPLDVAASANHPKPGQKSTTCYFNTGPKVGQTESLKALEKPVLIGKTCRDNAGNSGIAVEDQEDEEAEAAEEAAKEAEAAGKAMALQTTKNSVPLSTSCEFKQGPRTGQVENFQGKLLPIPVGSTCSDGIRSVGVAVPETHAD